MDRTKSGDYKGVLLALIIAAAAIFRVRVVPFAAIALPLALAYALTRGGYIKGGIAIALAMLIAYLQSPMLCALLAAAFVPPAVAAAYVIRKRMRFYNSVLYVSAAALAGFVLSAGVLRLITGMGPVEYAAAFFSSLLSAAGDQAALSLYQLIKYTDVMMGYATLQSVTAVPASEAIKYIVDMFQQAVNFYLVGLMINAALLVGLLSVVVPRAIAKKQGMRVGSVPAFSDMALPKHFWIAYILSYLVAYIGAEMEWPGFDIAVITIHSVYSFVLMIQGLSFLDFLYKRRGMRAAGRNALHVLAYLIGGFVLVFIGLIENCMGLRARMKQKGGMTL